MLFSSHLSLDVFSRSRPAVLGLLAALFFAASASSYGQAVWDGGGTTSNWSDSANWGATIPASGGALALQFGGTSQLAPNNDFASFTASSLTFNAGAGAFVLGGNAISLAGNITNSSGSLQTINQGLTLTAASIVNTGASGITIGGAVDGLFGITKQGAGTLTLNGANNYTGATSIVAGTVIAGNNKTFGSTELGTTVTSGATLILSGGVVVTGQASATQDPNTLVASSRPYVPNPTRTVTMAAPSARRVVASGEVAGRTVVASLDQPRSVAALAPTRTTLAPHP